MMKTLILLLIPGYFFVIHPALGQNTDSLKNVLNKKNLSVNDRAITLGRLYFSLKNENPGEAMSYFSEMEKYVSQCTDPFIQGNIYSLIGLVNESRGNTTLAMEAFLNALKAYQSISNHEKVAECYLSIGELLRSVAEHNDALKYFNTGLELARKHNLHHKIKEFYERFAAVLFEKTLFRETLAYLDSATNYHRELNNDEFLISVYITKGAVWREIGNPDSSIHYLSKSAEFAKRFGDFNALAGVYNNLSGVYFNLKKYSLAADYAHKSLALSLKDSVLPYMEVAYLMLSKVYQATKNFDSALHYFIFYTDVRWKNFNVQKNKEIANLQTKHELEAKVQENEKLKLKNELQNQRIKLQSAIILITFLVLLILTAIPVYLNRKRKRLKKHNELLQIKNQEIEDAARQLRELIETKDKLFSIIAHDIKNPLQSIIGFSQLLEIEIGSNLDEEKRQYIYYIRQGGENLNFLLENLLRWSMIQSGKLAFIFENANVSDIVSHVLNLFESSISTKKLQIINELQNDLFAYIDQSTISVVFRNLISNAIKFSHVGGKIKLKSQVSKDTVSISIQDEGMGMSNEIIKNLFTLKIPSQPGTTGEKGSGLGLLLCKEFVEKNNGKISVKSLPMQGTTFTIELPAAKT